MNNDVRLALNICTYKRENYIRRNLSLLLTSKFFDSSEGEYYGRLEVFIVDNASEISIDLTEGNDKVHIIYNRNTGGSGGFQKGIEEIRRYGSFTHVIFMDDDVTFEMDSFYILFDFLQNVDERNAYRPVAGRMLDIDNPNIQWTAAEKWNAGDIEHVEFLRDITDASNPYTLGRVIYDTDADYGGFWFCCYPYEYVRANDILPFFIHCDDVEYGLRYGKTPIIIEGVHVWHETWEKKMSPVMLYYDTRNALLVNEIYGLNPPAVKLIADWKNKITEYHVKQDYLSEYMVIIGMRDFLKGLLFIKSVNSEILHRKLISTKTTKYKNAIAWRLVERRFRHRYSNRCNNAIVDIALD